MKSSRDEVAEALAEACSMVELSAMIVQWALMPAALPRELEARERSLIAFAVDHAGTLVNRAADLHGGC